MKIVMTAAAAVLLASPVWAQTAAAPQAPVTDAGVLPGATAAPDCGNLYGMAGRAFCVSAPLAGVGALAEAYIADLGTKGWIPAGGDDNRVVFVRRRDGGRDLVAEPASRLLQPLAQPQDAGVEPGRQADEHLGEPRHRGRHDHQAAVGMVHGGEKVAFDL